MSKSWVFALLLLLYLLCLAMLATAASPLLWELSAGFPLGTLIAWYILAIGPYLIFSWLAGTVKRHTFYRKPIYTVLLIFLQISILPGIAWGFISYGLAGNWSFTFNGGDLSKLFWNMTKAVAALPLFGAMAFWLIALLQYITTKKKPGKDS